MNYCFKCFIDHSIMVLSSVFYYPSFDISVFVDCGSCFHCFNNINIFKDSNRQEDKLTIFKGECNGSSH